MSAAALTITHAQGVIDDGVLHGRPSRVRIDHAVIRIPQAAGAALIPAGSPARLERLVGGSALLRVSLSLTDVVAEVRLSATPNGRLAAELIAVRTDLIGVPVSLVAAALREYIPAQPWLTAGPGPRWEVDVVALGRTLGLELQPVAEVRGDAGTLEVVLRRGSQSGMAEVSMSEEKPLAQRQAADVEEPVPSVSISLPPSLEISEAPAAGDPPLDVTLEVPNPGPGVLHLRLKPEPDWVTVDKPAITIRPGESGQVKVSVEPASVTAENRGKALLKAEWAVEEGAQGVGSATIPIRLPPPRRLLLCPNPDCSEFVHSEDLACAHCGLVLRYCPECGAPAARSAERCSARQSHPLPAMPMWAVVEGDAARTGGMSELKAGALRTAWSASLDGGPVTGPVAAWGIVFAVGGAPARLIALDLPSGRKLWEQSLPDGATLSRFSAPAVTRTKVVVTDANGLVVALDGASGKGAWVSRIPFPTPAGCLAAGSGLFVATRPPDQTGGHVIALWPEDGAKVWSARLTAGAALPLAAREGHVLAHGDDGTLRSLMAADGSLAWERPLGKPAFGPVAADGLVLASLESELVALDPGSGAERWRFAAPSPLAVGPAVAGGRIYACTNAAVFSLEAASGAKAAETALTGAPIAKPLPTSDGFVVVSAGAIHRWAGAELIELAKLDTPPIGAAAAIEGLVLLPTAAGLLALTT
jgi:outer membrane protein assembly factor BamB